VRGLSPHAGFAEHPGAVVRGVPARADADQLHPATREALGRRLRRLGVGEQPAQVLGLGLHRTTHSRHASTVWRPTGAVKTLAGASRRGAGDPRPRAESRLLGCVWCRRDARRCP
jgi:hypothetical protein